MSQPVPVLPYETPASRRRVRVSIPYSKITRLLASHAFLIAVGVVMMIPFIWMIFASFKTLPDIESFSFWPHSWHPENYSNIFRDPKISRNIHFARYYFNSIFVAAWVTFLTCFTSALAAFAFARLKWRGRDNVFLLYLATLMVPGVVTIIPNFALMVKLHLLDTYTGLIVPSAFSAFGVFLLRQFMLGIPASLDEAAAIDGASPWQIFWDVILPLTRPGLITLAIFAFLGNYGSFFWPLVIVKSEPLRTLPIGLLFFDTQYGRATNLLMAGSVMAVIPPLILFVFSQKFIVRGIQLGAVKG